MNLKIVISTIFLLEHTRDNSQLDYTLLCLHMVLYFVNVLKNYHFYTMCILHRLYQIQTVTDKLRKPCM